MWRSVVNIKTRCLTAAVAIHACGLHASPPEIPDSFARQQSVQTRALAEIGVESHRPIVLNTFSSDEWTSATLLGALRTANPLAPNQVPTGPAEAFTWRRDSNGLPEIRGRHAFRLGGPYVLAGDWPKVDALPAPSGLSGFVDWKQKSIDLEWLPDGSGTLSATVIACSAFLCEVAETGSSRHSIPVPRENWRWVQELTGLKPGELPATVWRDGTGLPSPGASIAVDGCAFREAVDASFFRGLNPTWTAIANPSSMPTLRMHRAVRFVDQGRSRVEFYESEEAYHRAMALEALGPRADWLRDPALKAGYQGFAVPAGFAALCRPVAASKFGSYDASVMLRLGGIGDGRGRVRVMVWNGAAGELDGIQARLAAWDGKAALEAHMGLDAWVVFDTATAPKNDAEWITVGTDGAKGGRALISEGPGSALALFVIAEDTGDANLGVDWFEVRYLDCKDEMP